MGGAWGDCNGLTQNVVRYDLPTFGGFSVSASWGEDDMWDVAAGTPVNGAASSSRPLPPTTRSTHQQIDDGWSRWSLAIDAQYFQAGAFVMHVPTGLFAYGAYAAHAERH